MVKKTPMRRGGANRWQRFQATKASYDQINGQATRAVDGLLLLESTPTEVAYLDSATGGIVIAIRGSADAADWMYNNSRIPFGQLSQGPRYQQAKAFIEHIRSTYPDSHIEAVTGHSLGGAIATELRREFGAAVIPEVVVWNPANQPEDHARGKEDGLTRIHHRDDALVQLPGMFGLKDATWLNGGPLANEMVSPHTTRGLVDAHGLDSFNSSEWHRQHAADPTDLAYAHDMMVGAGRKNGKKLLKLVSRLR